MLVESLVIFACIEGHGCTQSTGAYYVYNRDAKKVVQNVQDYGKRIAKDNELLVYAVTPVYALASGNTARFKMGKGFILKLDVKDQGIGLEWTY